MTTRKILVRDQHGNRTLEAELFATFTEYVQGVAYQFVVTRSRGQSSSVVTHKRSGFSLGPVLSSHVAASNFDYKLAGRLALAAVIQKHGEARVASSLRRVDETE